MLVLWFGLIYSVFCLLLLWLFAQLILIGTDLSRYDSPHWDLASDEESPSPQNAKVLGLVERMQCEIDAAPLVSRLGITRRVFDSGIGGGPPTPEHLGVARLYVDAGSVPAEWILAPDSDPDRRLLYVHGGAFTVGSPGSHRYITAALARQAEISVLAIDYRLMPEHSRRAGIDDCRAAYRWMLTHGPQRPSTAAGVYVAGDSAGGNLILMLVAWARDRGIRQADAAVALSPGTDSTLSSPSLRKNRASDPFLGRSMGRLVRLPRAALAYMTWFSTRMRPQNAQISPLRGDLSRLPPTLVQASNVEMLLDDAIRYVNKAREAGSPAELQLWPGMVHVWQLFDLVLPEAREALKNAAEFIRLHPGAGTARDAERV